MKVASLRARRRSFDVKRGESSPMSERPWRRLSLSWDVDRQWWMA